MKDVIEIDDQLYVLAGSSRADDRTRVLKHGESFGLYDRYGDIQHLGIGEQGLYLEGTRYLSFFELSVNEHRPMLLNSSVSEDNSLLMVDLTTPDLHAPDRRPIPKGTLHLLRTKLLWEGAQYERIRLVNYGDEEVAVTLGLRFDADYADIFEVRGVKRPQRGERMETTFEPDAVHLGYCGLDGAGAFRGRGGRAPGRGGQCVHLQRAVQRLAQSFGGGSADADHGHAGGTLSLCRGALVQHRLRA